MKQFYPPSIRLLVVVTLLVFTGCRETIVHGVDESIANRIALVLSQSSIEAEKTQDGAQWNISVDAREATRALAVIDEQRVIRPSLLSGASQSGNALLQSREERQRAMENERARALEATLERLPGVREARVHLILSAEEPLGFSPRQKHDSASVLLIKGAGANVDESQVRKLIAGGAGIDVSTISVVVTEQPQVSSTAAVRSKPEPTAPLEAASTRGMDRAQVVTFGGVLLGLTLFGVFLTRSRKQKKQPATPALGEPANEPESEIPTVVAAEVF